MAAKHQMVKVDIRLQMVHTEHDEQKAQTEQKKDAFFKLLVFECSYFNLSQIQKL